MRFLKRAYILSNNYKNLNNQAQKMSKKSFESLNFDNLALKTLPIDPITKNYVREVKNSCFSRVCQFFKINSHYFKSSTLYTWSGYTNSLRKPQNGCLFKNSNELTGSRPRAIR